MFVCGEVLIAFVTMSKLKRLVKLSTKHFVAERKSKEEKNCSEVNISRGLSHEITV